MNPHRRFEIVVTVSADDWESAQREVARVLDHVAEHGPQCNMASGGYSTGSSVQVTEDAEMTHDRFEQELDAWISTERAKARP